MQQEIVAAWWLQLDEEQLHFLDQVHGQMKNYFGADQRRISHAQAVTRNAVNMLHYIEAEPVLTLTATYLHDIGIPEAERKYNRCDGKIQEQEGPPVARELLFEIGATKDMIARVCELVGHHHTPQGVDSPEFRVLWDADALVNLSEVVEGKDPAAIEAILYKAMVTEPGYQMARKIYLPQLENKSRADSYIDSLR